MRRERSNSKAVREPHETQWRCTCHCVPSSLVTANGIRLVLAVNDGRYDTGQYHKACSDCLRNRPKGKRPPRWISQRELDRARILAS